MKDDYAPPTREEIAQLPKNPLKLLMSGCLAGLPCGTDGTDYGEGKNFAWLLGLSNVQVTTFCPEEFSFGTPRDVPNCVGGNGFDVLDGRARVVTHGGEDFTDGMLRAAEKMRRLALEKKVDLAFMQNVSAACGTSIVYDGHRDQKKLLKGPGVASAALLRAGVRLVGEQDRRALEYLHQHLDPGHVVDTEARNNEETDWYQSYFES